MVVVPPGDLAFGRFAVTFDEWDACVAAGACRGGQDDHGWGKGRQPVINVTWADAKSYADWLSLVTGQSYALPSEAEFEAAARAGTTTTYWWGDTVGEGHANCRDCGGPWAGHRAAPVGSFPANPYGLYDMAGNVWAWTADCWAAPPEGAECRDRVIRGGSWYYYAIMTKTTARARNDGRQWSYNIGIRVVRRLMPNQAPR
jgi:formylglycine-generating enzyme required for sulfatase activity